MDLWGGRNVINTLRENGMRGIINSIEKTDQVKKEACLFYQKTKIIDNKGKITIETTTNL